MFAVNHILLILLILVILLIISYLLNPDKAIGFNQPKMNAKVGKVHNQCSVHSCGMNGIDPVSDPAYNMKQIIKQSILLEEHLVEPNKRCRDCIVKHFLHIQGLHEEALWLANENCGKYPMLIETTGFYSEQFDEWLTSYDDEKTLQHITSKLRDVRKKLVSLYFFNDENNTEDVVLIKNKNEVKDYKDVLGDVKTVIDLSVNNPRPALNNLNVDSYDKIY